MKPKPLTLKQQAKAQRKVIEKAMAIDLNKLLADMDFYLSYENNAFAHALRNDIAKYKEHDAIRKAIEKASGAWQCEWRSDDDGVYHTACGEAFAFDSGTATENGSRFCFYYGGSLVTIDSDCTDG